MKKILSIIILFTSLNLSAQDIRALEADISQTIISDVKEIEKKAEKIFELDPFNEIATYYLTEAYRYTGNDSLIPKFFEDKISENVGNILPFLLSAKYQFNHFSISDTARLKVLKKAIALEPQNIEANYLLGHSYYQLFNQLLNSDSSATPTFFALQSRDYLRTATKIDSNTILNLKYTVVQLSNFLGDDETATQFERLALSPKVDENHMPKYGQFYFPLNRFIQLNENWQYSYKTDLIRETEMAKFVLQWYSNQLYALNEPLLFDQVKDTIFRFTWLRTFHHPVAIRIQKSNGKIKLTWKMSDGSGGYAPGHLIIDETKELEEADWKKFQLLLIKANYWKMPTNDQTAHRGTDGSQWIIEGIQNGSYHVVDRWSPRNSAYQEVGLFLINLTDLKIPNFE